MAQATRGLPSPPQQDEVASPRSKEEERANKREHAIQEIVTTEETYAELLGCLVKFFVHPLGDFKILTQQEHNTLFPQLEVIRGLSDRFLADLHQRRSEWDPDQSKLSDLFGEFVPFFRMYQGYVNNHEKSVGLMRKLESKQKWVEYTKSVRKDCKGFDLSSLLILPIQRLPRYKLLLGEVMKNMRDDHPDHEALAVAAAKVKEVSLQINDRMKEFERRETVKKIERQFTGSIQLLAPARRFERRGKLWKVCRKNNRLYHFFLFSDLVLYASSYGTKLNLHNSIEIDAAFQVEWIEDDVYGDIVGRSFRVVSAKKSFVVYADDPGEARQWFEDIEATVESHQKSLIGLQQVKDSQDKAVAAWVPDSHHSRCTMKDCDSKFSILNRRHHCRCCGALVCGNCSKFKLPNAEGVMQRSCKRCYFEQGDQGAANGSKAGAEDDDDDDSSDDEFQEEINTLHKISFYVESDELSTEDIFMKFGRGVGTYVMVPAQQLDRAQYSVSLVVYTAEGFAEYSVGLVTKKSGIHYRLKLSKKSKDFAEIGGLVEYLGKKEKMVFSYPIPRQEVMALTQKESQQSMWGNTGAVTIARGLENYPKARAQFDYEGEVLGDLTLRAGDIIYVIDKEGEEGWWTGVIGDRQGLFPSTYVEMIDAKPIPVGKNEPNEGDVLIARFEYAEGGSEELCFQVGDKIILIDKDDSGWWLGKLEKSGAVGWFAPDLTTPFALPNSPERKTQPAATDNSNPSKFKFQDTEEKSAPKKSNPTGGGAKPPPKTGTAKSGGAKPPPKKSNPSAAASNSSSASAKPPPKKANSSKSVTRTSNAKSSGGGGGGGTVVTGTGGVVCDDNPEGITIDYESLKKRQFGEHSSFVNSTKLELYLPDDVFEDIFKMDREEYNRLPLWKQRRNKKEVGLF